MVNQTSLDRGSLTIRGDAGEAGRQVLTAEALSFLGDLVRRFRPAIDEALSRRALRRTRLRSGERLDFLPETAEVRAAEWKVAPAPPDLTRRTVEITGPVDRKMIINALNSGADTFMADFEDSTAPTWRNLIEGQQNLIDAVRRTITFEDAATGKTYRLNEKLATLIVRPRGLHLPEVHVEVDGQTIPGCLLDFGLFVFHNARELLARGSGPYLYLPKLESHREARLWNEILAHSERALELPAGSIRPTCLIETLPAAFEMDEFLYELRERAVGLNCGRWDYIFSFIKTHRDDPAAVLPDRSQVTMEQPFLRAYARHLVRVCHRRGAHAIGGMAAQIPIRGDEAASARALAAVRADKEREVNDGHDGTWVAHPGLVAVAREVFESRMEGPNQLDRPDAGAYATAADLLRVPAGTRTEQGLRLNVRVGVQYLEAWLSGVGCVPLNHLMEDAATAEISRSQLWQWTHHGAQLDDGRAVTRELVSTVLDEELGSASERTGHLARAADLFLRVATSEEMEEFLTVPAYAELHAIHDSPSSSTPRDSIKRRQS